MAVELLSAREREIIFQCMKAVAELIDDWEIHARLGLTPEQLRAIIEQWPEVDDRNQQSEGFLAINNSLNEICHGLSVDGWAALVNASQDEVEDTYRNWLRIQGIRGGIR